MCYCQVCTATKRPRSRELAVGTLANIASHQETCAILLEHNDILGLVNSILWNENDARVLHEATRYVKSIVYAILGWHQVGYLTIFYSKFVGGISHVLHQYVGTLGHRQPESNTVPDNCC
jgi:hypothetical protein